MPDEPTWEMREALGALLQDNELAMVELEVLGRRALHRQRTARFLDFVDDETLARPLFDFLIGQLEQGALVEMERMRVRHNRDLLRRLHAEWTES
jgi:hypothetical protein